MDDDLLAARSELLLTLMERRRQKVDETIQAIVNGLKPFTDQMRQTTIAIGEATNAIFRAFTPLFAAVQKAAWRLSRPRCHLNRKEQNWVRYCKRHGVKNDT